MFTRLSFVLGTMAHTKKQKKMISSPRKEESMRFALPPSHTRTPHHLQLTDKSEDRDKFRSTWDRLCTEEEGAEQRLLTAAAELEDRYSNTPVQPSDLGRARPVLQSKPPKKKTKKPTQQPVDRLIAEAEAEADVLHGSMKR